MEKRGKAWKSNGGFVMGTELLLTSFAPWRKYQRSNASDDLLVALQERGLPDSVGMLRQLPVNLPVAKEITIAKLEQLQPKMLVLCGMAESRSRLSLEQQATVRNKTYQTPINLNQLVSDLQTTEISQDAGRYVCNSLYYAMLEYAATHPSGSSRYPCLFVHIPVLTEKNRSLLLEDMGAILDRLLVQARCKNFNESASPV
ncbi:peptidase C15 [Leptolyngbya ohadii]|uniref:peptidase C15 n=1 Tax=Leptolyngbya ohadii TaxID=1962290 RepID=UPI00117A44E7|nr:peptidase C15 [Leptolyngbya ohadii]